MSKKPKIGNRIVFSFCLAMFLFLAGTSPAACPPESEEIGRHARGDKTVIRCRCLGERLHSGGQCVAPENAPLGKMAMSVLSGRAFTATAALQAYARSRNLPAHAIDYWDFGTLEAKFGRYGRAQKFLALARDFFRQDEIVVAFDKSLLNLRESRSRELSKYFRHYSADDQSPFFYELFLLPGTQDGCGIDCVKKSKHVLYHRIMYEARLERESGAFESAVEKYKDALAVAALAGTSGDLRRRASDGIVWSRQLQFSRQRLEQTDPEGWSRIYRTRRQEVAAARAEMLASHLSEAGRPKVALPYLEEARAVYRKLNSWRVPYLENRISEIRTSRSSPPTRRTDDGRPITIYTNASSQTQIVLDAVEYGKGDWSRSVAFLETALSADSENPKLFGALNYVRGLSAADTSDR